MLRDLLLGRLSRGGGEVVKTLIDEFDYPSHGPGMMWERMAALVRSRGGEVRLATHVEKIQWGEGGVEAIEVSNGDGKELLTGTDFISSMPMRELVRKLEPQAPAEVSAAANSLQYRDFLTVVLIVNRRDVFPDNWIYIHDPRVRLGRVQNFKNWSPHMVPDEAKTCLGLEYFCFEGDGLWDMKDSDLIALGKREMETLGLVRSGEIEDGVVVRVPKAYPVYDSTYKQSLAALRRFFDAIPNLQLVGRNGMHRYNNQDHSMLTAMLAVRNILGANFDLWEVNADQGYQEEVTSISDPRTEAHAHSTQPLIPERVKRARAGASTLESEA